MNLQQGDREQLKKMDFTDCGNPLENIGFENVREYTQHYLYELLCYFKVAPLPIKEQIKECDRLIDAYADAKSFNPEFVNNRLDTLKKKKHQLEMHIKALEDLMLVIHKDIKTLGLDEEDRDSILFDYTIEE